MKCFLPEKLIRESVLKVLLGRVDTFGLSPTKISDSQKEIKYQYESHFMNHTQWDPYHLQKVSVQWGWLFTS